MSEATTSPTTTTTTTVITPEDDDFLQFAAAAAAATPIPTTTNEYCDIPTDILEPFDTIQFQNTRVIQWMHDIPPRYGKPSDVLLLMTGSQLEQQGERDFCFVFFFGVV
jgi:hypothetical protein